MMVGDRDMLAGEAAQFLKEYPQIRHLDAFIIDLCGNAVGKRYPREDIAKIYRDGTSICAAMQLTDVCGVTWDTLGHGFSDGDPDAECWPVCGTLKPVPWSAEPRAQCLMRLSEPGRSGPVWYEPRTILENVVGRFGETGLRPVAAVELEFYLIDQEREENGAPRVPEIPGTRRRSEAGRVFNMHLLDSFAEVVDAMESACHIQGLPVTTICKEYGPGQFELNLKHLADPVAAADHAALLRRLVQQVARAQGFDATFMSKPFPGESGSALQVNLSLEDASGKNAFDPGRHDGEAVFGHVIAGMQALLAETFAIFAPNFHAYRRFAPDQFTPVTTTWGENNRSVAFRVPVSAPQDRRIEHRAAGAEANPYLVMAAVLAAAHHGLVNRLQPTPISSGNAGAEVDPGLPMKLWTALACFERAAVLPDYFGARYIEAYADVKRNEFEALLSEMQPREFDWYL